MSSTFPLLAPMQGTEHQQIAGVQLDIARAGSARVKRVIYPAGFHWSTHIKPIVGTDFCMHAHVGFLAHGQIHIEFPDGCRMEFTAPQAVVIEPGHDGWVVGNEPAVLIEFDFEGKTAHMCGMPDRHAHDGSMAQKLATSQGSFKVQGDHWVHSHGAPRGNVAGGQCGQQE